MKRTLSFLIFIIICITTYSQDLIVTNENDSINCKITKIKRETAFFTFQTNDDFIRTMLPLSKINTYQYNYFPESEAPANINIDNIGLPNLDSKDFPYLNISVIGGYSYLIGEISDDLSSELKDYIKELKSGYNFGADISYYFAESYGAGIKYNIFKTSNSIDGFFEDENGNQIPGTFSESITTSYIGPSFSARIMDKKRKNVFYGDFSFGSVIYVNHATIPDDCKISGNTLGLSIGIGYNFNISKNFYLGIKASFLTATLKSYKINDGTSTEKVKLESGEYENLGRLDMSISLSFLK